MTKKLTIGIIGGGNMGAAIIGGIRKKFNVCVAEKDVKRQRYLKTKFKIATVDIGSLMERSDVIILAVKPQDFDTILQEVRQSINRGHLVISIAAGITTTYIEKRLGKGIRVVRTMPNLPAQIGMGMTGISKGKNATDADIHLVGNIFGTIGRSVVVKESLIDSITAVSGSGPAYVFYFVECFMSAAGAVGLDPKVAKNLVLETLRGSLALLEKSSDEAGTLRQKVTSKGGTTEAALKAFAKGKFEEVFEKALKAAKKRAKELSK